jgi:hypothetical protein
MKIKPNLLPTFTNMTFTHTKNKNGDVSLWCWHTYAGNREGWDFCLMYNSLPSLCKGSTDVILVTFWWRVPHLINGIVPLGSDVTFLWSKCTGRPGQKWWKTDFVTSLLLFLWLLLIISTFIFTLNVFFSVILTFDLYWSHRSTINNQCTCH